jgi:hypothetical protein
MKSPFDYLFAYFTKAKERKSCAHAYCIVGSTGMGKRVFARRVAALLLETDHVATHPDYLEVDDPGDMQIPIDMMRAITARASLAPVRAQTKVIVVGKIDQCTREAANAILKLLEDPPEKTLFLCTAATIDGVLPTVRSRLQMLRPTYTTDAGEEGSDARATAHAHWTDFLKSPHDTFGDMRSYLLEQESVDMTLRYGISALRAILCVSYDPRIAATIRAIDRARGQLRANAAKDLVIDNLLLTR